MVSLKANWVFWGPRQSTYSASFTVQCCSHHCETEMRFQTAILLAIYLFAFMKQDKMCTLSTVESFSVHWLPDPYMNWPRSYMKQSLKSNNFDHWKNWLFRKINEVLQHVIHMKKNPLLRDLKDTLDQKHLQLKLFYLERNEISLLTKKFWWDTMARWEVLKLG